MLKRIKGHVKHYPVERVSPLAVPVLMEIGREHVPGEASEAILADAADELIALATLGK
jgi:ATP-dependent Lhr-like helicase